MTEGVLGFPRGKGHVSRNVRLCLISADAVRPYVMMDALSWGAEGVGGSVEVVFEVGGAMRIDNIR